MTSEYFNTHPLIYDEEILLQDKLIFKSLVLMDKLKIWKMSILIDKNLVREVPVPDADVDAQMQHLHPKFLYPYCL